MKRRQRRELGRSSKQLIPSDIDAAMTTNNKQNGATTHRNKDHTSTTVERRRSSTLSPKHRPIYGSLSYTNAIHDRTAASDGDYPSSTKSKSKTETMAIFGKDTDYLKKNKRLSEVSRKMDALKERTKSELAKIEKITSKCNKVAPMSLTDIITTTASSSSTSTSSACLANVTKNVSKSDDCFMAEGISANHNNAAAASHSNNFGGGVIKREKLHDDNRSSRTTITGDKFIKPDRISFKDDTVLYMRESSAAFHKDRKRSSSTEETFRHDYDPIIKTSNSHHKKKSSLDTIATTDLFLVPKKLQNFRRKSSEEVPPAINHIVSILKKKDHTDQQSSSASSNASPVTFSSSVVDTPTRTMSASKQGILKKRSSLDESRYSRSHSPDERSILVRTPRRNSLEELQHIGILKQRSYDSKCGTTPNSEPHSILKKKETSTPSENYPKHVSISEAVILAAAELCKDAILNDNCSDYENNIRPILKQDTPSISTPRPILKKKQSSETEEIRPILKTSRKSSREETDDSDDFIRPHRKIDSPAKRMSFCEFTTPRGNVMERSISMENHNDIASIILATTTTTTTMNDGLLPGTVCVTAIEKPLVSVAERIRNMEQVLKSERSSSQTKRGKSRYSTQPVTIDEICR